MQLRLNKLDKQRIPHLNEANEFTGLHRQQLEQASRDINSCNLKLMKIMKSVATLENVTKDENLRSTMTTVMTDIMFELNQTPSPKLFEAKPSAFKEPKTQIKIEQAQPKRFRDG